jgi:RNA polymerase sigma factor (sigma-70 family)
MTDHEIIERIKQDDLEHALRALYKSCYKEVIQDLGYKGAGKDDADDVFQEAMLVLVKKIQLNAFRNESGLKTFLKGIARNVWLSTKRSEERRKYRESNYKQGAEEVEAPVLWRESQKEFAELLNSIGDGCKTLLLKYYFEQVDLETLAEHFNYKSTQVLRNRKVLCLKKLRELLKGREQMIDVLLTDSYYG